MADNPLTQQVNLPIVNKKVPLWGLLLAGGAGLYVLMSGKRTSAPGEGEYFSEQTAGPTPGKLETAEELTAAKSINTEQTETTEQNNLTPLNEEIQFSSFSVEETSYTPETFYLPPVYTPPGASASAPASAPRDTEKAAARARPIDAPSAAQVLGAIKGAQLKKAVKTDSSIFDKPLKLVIKDPASSTMAPAPVVKPAPVSTAQPSAATQKERAIAREQTSPTLNTPVKPAPAPVTKPATTTTTTTRINRRR